MNFQLNDAMLDFPHARRQTTEKGSHGARRTSDPHNRQVLGSDRVADSRSARLLLSRYGRAHTPGNRPHHLNSTHERIPDITHPGGEGISSAVRENLPVEPRA